MNRRAFTRTVARTVTAAFGLTHTDLPGFSKIPGDSFDEASDVPIQLSVMLWTVFNDLPFEQRLEKIAEAGYRNVELVGEYEKWNDADFERVNVKRKELGVTFDCTAGLKHGVSNPEDRRALLAELRRALTIMERIECPSMILLSGDRVPSISREAQHQSCIDTLKEAASLVEGRKVRGERVRLLLETIDPEENPKYYLTSITEALQIVEAVNHPQVQLLYDFFHEQIANGNLIAKLDKSIAHLGLVHIADVPGRHEPGTGEINYENIFRRLAELKYTGIAAMEFRPSGDPIAQLRAAREMALRAARAGLGKVRPS